MNKLLLFVPIFIVSCVQEELRERPRPPPQIAVDDTSSSDYSSSDSYTDPFDVCRGIIVPAPSPGEWMQDQWVIGILTPQFHPTIFFDREMNAKACLAHFPGLEVRKRKAGCCWIRA